jgi:hypothetical protein
LSSSYTHIELQIEVPYHSSSSGFLPTKNLDGDDNNPAPTHTVVHTRGQSASSPSIPHLMIDEARLLPLSSLVFMFSSEARLRGFSNFVPYHGDARLISSLSFSLPSLLDDREFVPVIWTGDHRSPLSLSLLHTPASAG